MLNKIIKLFSKSKTTKLPEYFNMYPDEMRTIILDEIYSNPNSPTPWGISSSEHFWGVGEFGLEITNPIPTFGVPANEIYLNKLLLPNGLKPRWRRIGSTSTFSITKSIDMYEIFDNQGETVCTLYINPYHLKISNKIPKGFKSSK